MRLDAIALRTVSEDWPVFAAANPDLLSHPAALLPYYRDETLHSELAKRAFVLPDRLAPLPTGRN